MVSRDQRDPIVLQKVRKQGMTLARVNTKDCGKCKAWTHQALSPCLI